MSSEVQDKEEFWRCLFLGKGERVGYWKYTGGSVHSMHHRGLIFVSKSSLFVHFSSWVRIIILTTGLSPFFSLTWTIFKGFIEFVTILLLFYVLVLWSQGMWDLSAPTRVGTHTVLCTGRRSLNHWTTREVPRTESWLSSANIPPKATISFISMGVV